MSEKTLPFSVVAELQAEKIELNGHPTNLLIAFDNVPKTMNLVPSMVRDPLTAVRREALVPELNQPAVLEEMVIPFGVALTAVTTGLWSVNAGFGSGSCGGTLNKDGTVNGDRLEEYIVTAHAMLRDDGVSPRATEQRELLERVYEKAGLGTSDKLREASTAKRAEILAEAAAIPPKAEPVVSETPAKEQGHGGRS